MAKAFGCPTALLSTAERLRRVLSPTESLPRYDAGKIRELQSSERENWLSLTGVAVEKLLLSKSTKIKSRQEALRSIFSGRLDIFYPHNFS